MGSQQTRQTATAARPPNFYNKILAFFNNFHP